MWLISTLGSHYDAKLNTNQIDFSGALFISYIFLNLLYSPPGNRFLPLKKQDVENRICFMHRLCFWGHVQNAVFQRKESLSITSNFSKTLKAVFLEPKQF